MNGIFAQNNGETTQAQRQRSKSLTTPQRIVYWLDGREPTNITSAVLTAYAASAGSTVTLTTASTYPLQGQQIVTWSPGALDAGVWQIEARMTTATGKTSSVFWQETVLPSIGTLVLPEPTITVPGIIAQSGDEMITFAFTAAQGVAGVLPINTAITATFNDAPLPIDAENRAQLERPAAIGEVKLRTVISNSTGVDAVNEVIAAVQAYTVPAAMAAPEPVVLSAAAVRWPRPAPPASGGNAISSYRFYPTVNGIAQDALLDVGDAVDLTGLTAGDTVVGEFRAVNAAGESLPGATATAQTWQLPAQMSAPNITGGVSLVVVGAIDPANLNDRPLNTDPPGYRYQFYNAGGDVVLTVNRADTSGFTQTGVPAGAGVYVTVSAATDAGRASLESPPSNAVTVATGASATLTEIVSIDDVPTFDSGAARGLTSATVALSATTDADNGATILVRQVKFSDWNAVTPDVRVAEGAWQTLGTASGGAGSGTANLTLDVGTYTGLECMVQGSAAPATIMTKKITIGHVWSVWEQSNLARTLLGAPFTTITAETILRPDDVKLWKCERVGQETAGVGPVSVVRVNSTDVASGQASPGLVALANALAIARPGEKFAIVGHLVSGTSPLSMIDPDNLSRKWPEEIALHNAATAHGSPVGLAINGSWDAWQRNSFNALKMVPIMTQKLVDGTPVALGATVSPAAGTAEDFVLHHSMTELYDLAYTKMAYIGAMGERIGPDTNIFDFTTLTEAGNTSWENMRPNWLSVLTNKADFPEFLDYEWDTTGAMRGISDGAGGWTDTSHFSSQDDYGIPYYAGIIANHILLATGMISFDRPEITHSDWTSTHIDVWNPDYDITTHRNLNGGTSAFVRGFVFDDKIIRDEAQLLANAGGSGRQGVRITPAGGVDGSEIFEYGRGGVPGLSVSPADYIDRYVLDLPVMNVGQAKLAAMPAVTRQTFTSNLVGTPFFVKAVGDPARLDPAGFGTASGFTIKGDMRVTAHNVITATPSQGYRMEVLSGRNVRFSVAGRGEFTTAGTVFPAGAFVPFVWTFDLTGGTTTIWWGDANVETFALTGTGATIENTARQIIMLGSNLGADVRFAEVWKAATATRDTAGLGAPHKRLEAGAGGTVVQIPADPAW